MSLDINTPLGFWPRIVVCGTSITQGISPGIEWEVQLESDINANYTTKYGTPVSPPWSAGYFAVNGLPTTRQRVGIGATVINSGVSGNLASNANTDYAKRIAVYAPTHLVLEFGVNEIITAVSLATFLVQYKAIISKYLADFPYGKVILTTLFCVGEKHPFPNVGNFNDALVDDGINTAASTSFCGSIRFLAINTGYGLIDQRDETSIRETQFNLANLVGGVLFDASGPGGTGLHPQATMSHYASARGASTLIIP